MPKSITCQLISNGFGEDLIAAHIAQAFQQHYPNVRLIATPLIGPGLAYEKIGLSPTLDMPLLPSGGFIRNPKDLINDIKSGLLSQLKNQYQHIKTGPDVDIKICTGDVFCLWLGTRKKAPITAFLPTAKSDMFATHSPIETHFIKKLADQIYPRDAKTTTTFQDQGLPAHYFGNPMMDHLRASGKSYPFNETNSILGILPGSRNEAYENLKSIANIIDTLHPLSPNTEYVVAQAPSLKWEKIIKTLAQSGWQANSSERCLKKDGKRIHFIDHFVDVVLLSTIVCGLAGTANEQAIFLNRKVVCFPGSGPQTSPKRFLEQEKLLGENLIFIPTNHPETIAEKLATLLKSTQKSQAPSPQYAAKKIADHLLKGHS